MIIDIQNVHPPLIGDVFFISNASTSFDIYRIEVAQIRNDGPISIIEYKVWRSITKHDSDQEDFGLKNYDSYGEITLPWWYSWLDSGAMVKINSPQEELAYILKHGDNL